MRHQITTIAVITALVLMPASFTAQTSVVKYSLDSPVSEQFTNDCNGEQVQLSGIMHFEYFFETRPDGGTNYHIHSETHLKGVGLTTGVNYVGEDSTDYHTKTGDGQASDFTDTTKLKLVAQGPTPNMTTKNTLHVVVDKLGNIKVERTRSTSTCSR